jgi:urease accessory protein
MGLSRRNMELIIPMATEAPDLLLLLNWMSPTFPIGSFAYSHGLEWEIASGHMKTAADVEGWIRDVISSGSGWNDAVLFAHCSNGDIANLNALALALSGSAERYQETTQLGRNFAMASAVWTGIPAGEGDIAYPIAAGEACARLGLSSEATLMAFLQSFCAALVSVAVRLVPLGQTQGLVILRNLAGDIAAITARALKATLDDLGGNCLAAEMAAIAHETLEPRVFRT